MAAARRRPDRSLPARRRPVARTRRNRRPPARRSTPSCSRRCGTAAPAPASAGVAASAGRASTTRPCASAWPITASPCPSPGPGPHRSGHRPRRRPTSARPCRPAGPSSPRPRPAPRRLADHRAVVPVSDGTAGARSVHQNRGVGSGRRVGAPRVAPWPVSSDFVDMVGWGQYEVSARGHPGPGVQGVRWSIVEPTRPGRSRSTRASSVAPPRHFLLPCPAPAGRGAPPRLQPRQGCARPAVRARRPTERLSCARPARGRRSGRVVGRGTSGRAGPTRVLPDRAGRARPAALDGGHQAGARRPRPRAPAVRSDRDGRRRAGRGRGRVGTR